MALDIYLLLLELRRQAAGGAPPVIDAERAARAVLDVDALLAELTTLRALAAELAADEVLLPTLPRLEMERRLPALHAWMDALLDRPHAHSPAELAAAWQCRALDAAAGGDAASAERAMNQAATACALEGQRERRSGGRNWGDRITAAMERVGR